MRVLKRRSLAAVAATTVASTVLAGVVAPLANASSSDQYATFEVTQDGKTVTQQIPLVPAAVPMPGDNSGTAQGATASPPAAIQLSPGGVQPLTTQNGNTCDYWPANIIGWDVSQGDSQHYGSADTTFPRSNYREYGSVTSSDDGVGNNDGNAHSLVSVGTSVPMPANWPANTSIVMQYPWHDFGNLYVHSAISEIPFNVPVVGGGFSSGSASYTLSVQGFQGSLEGQSQVDSDGISAGSGSDHADTVQRGWDTNGGSVPQLTLAAPANTVMTAYLHIDMEANDHSTWGTYGQSQVTFDSSGGSTYYIGMEHARWIYQLPSGYALTSCGG